MPSSTATVSRAYQALCEASNDVGWPEHYQADLTEHDRARLASDDAPTVFGWVLRKCGTYLLDPRMSRGSLRSYLEHFRREGSEGRDLFFTWDGCMLHALSLEHFAVQMLQENERIEDGAQAHAFY